MSVSVKMPQLGESVTEGTVTRWLKQEGENVQADEPLLEVSTDKVDTEVPAPASGVLQRIVVNEDETVDVGAELAVIGDGAEGGGGGDSDDSADQPAEADQAQDEPPSEAPAEAPSTEQPAEDEEPAPKADTQPADSSGPASGTEITMPALGESVTEGTVTRWLKQVGDSVDVDEPLLEVSTDKVDTEIPSPSAGTLLEIRVEEDSTVDVGAVLAVIGDGSAEAGSTDSAPPAEEAATQEAAPEQEAETVEPVSQAAEAEEPEPAEQPAEEESTKPEPAAQAAPAAAPAPAPSRAPAADSRSNGAGSPDSDGSGDRSYVTPLVRKLAAEHDVDLASLSGTGVGGRIRKQDVLEAAEAAKAPAEAPAKQPAAAAASSAPARPSAANVDDTGLRGTTVKMTRLRKLIAKRMVESLQTAAQLTTVVEVDITKVAKLRDKVKTDFAAREGAKLSFLPFFALAAVEALKAHPVVNSTLDQEAGTITYHDGEHLGIAVDSNRGLVVPVIHGAGDLNLAGLTRKIAELAEKTRNGTASPDDLAGGTFTLTNTGSRGALFDTPIINQPQSAILGTGSVVKRAAVISDPDLGEIIAVRSMVYLALSYDHRIVDGADAARFLGTMKERLEAGAFESDLGL